MRQPPDPDGAFIRPFIVAEGRTHAKIVLRVETLVHARPDAWHAPLSFERRKIVEICQVPMSLAEIAAGLGVPLGVARVLIADLAASNLLSVLASARGVPVRVIERIRDLVEAL
ncbi:MAG TPA: DUF742 domain-containing protein [Amycolatopsis sp.]|uniref:DUF742 domain-containing protein n=1 Tax=Amycolatopsis sp. TaxID=37632 RepID=UPI002B48B432|nr:DUF742 domain-containing protein [Amycolatopsis sp.]HKS46554.1 DUF742 domain-containing protein [Amycolatopsis sp.]